ncbi:rod shape-determining protein MreC [Thermobispora bispora]|uniref:Cell shape-determining protein MreC n=1 Tax=Thermobispora bispora (strain ATCC 19993 / DSM 43833 / CBS 139.67 / JCM 10125 / KCTC 9307 / NBRC 14880 / R51) TaxID=469371 RepID=D6Y6K4_THEBD|nr:rod shape-determining protein MreC [Thermobispora bispora]ADG87576.1 Rod shape-determining protein MreC [Thermobispora bispora DSM 43833]QSI47501.1 rod shape-determining protein MreC [Thermobispora bispora]
MRKRGRRMPAVLLLGSILLIAADHWTTLDPMRTAGSAVFGPLESAVSATVRWVARPRPLEEAERENARLRAALQALGEPASGPGADAYRVLPAHVVGYGPDQTVTIDAGRGSGVGHGMTVFDGHGLIGTVIHAGPATATVRLATARASSIGARLEHSREMGVVTGVPERGLLRLSLINPHAEVKAGDLVVTLGSPSLRPVAPDVPIGTVIAVEGGAGSRTALLRPAARFASLDLVTVVLGPGPAAGGG